MVAHLDDNQKRLGVTQLLQFMDDACRFVAVITPTLPIREFRTYEIDVDQFLVAVEIRYKLIECLITNYVKFNDHDGL